ncbi:MAG: hypothetical protein ABSG15_06905 [FCB group bacterium]
MKFKITIAIFALLIICSTNLWAQRYSHSISANPIGLVFGIFNATYEQQTAPINSFTVFGNYWSVLDWSAYGFGGSYRWYPHLFEDGKKPLEGFSVGPRADIGFWSWTGFGSYSGYGGTSIAIGGEAAYKWVFGGFVVEPIIVLEINVSKVVGYTNYNAFAGGCNLGYAW